MHNYHEQLEIIKKIKLRDGDRKTLDCPFCGGHKKFTVEKQIDGKLLWNCYRASCTAKGIYQGSISVEAAKAYIAGNRDAKPVFQSNPLPQITTSVENRLEAIKYLQSVNSHDAYKNGLIQVRYAPGDNRVVFYNNDSTGAVGRSLGSGSKWMTYGDITGGIHVGQGDTAVIVEDVASACSVSRLENITGVALLGTNILGGIKKSLHSYKFKIIILDNDAASKSVSLVKQLSGNVTMRVTELDLKELEVEQISELLGSSSWTKM